MCHPGECPFNCNQKVKLRCPCKRIKRVSILNDRTPVCVDSILTLILRSFKNLFIILKLSLVVPVNTHFKKSALAVQFSVT
jgi:hypothetical protein